MTDISPTRLSSIDVFRAVTMFLMIMVNDMAGVNHIPAWIGHTEAYADGMGFADTIFPAFLYIVGLSLPLALKTRIDKGQPFLKTLAYILLRSSALIIMGFFHVNMEGYSTSAILPKPIFTILSTFAFFLIWLDYPARITRPWRYLLNISGILLLISLAFLYRGGSPAAPHGMEPSWWGILGIIGWAYLVCSVLFLVFRGKPLVMVLALLLFAAINVLNHTGLLPSLPVIGDASNETLIMAGTVSVLFYLQKPSGKLFIIPLLAAGVMLIVSGNVIRPYTGGISKIYSTPPWVFICAGISVVSFGLIYFLTDIKGKKSYFKIIHSAGTSTLTCYLIPYLLYSFFDLTDTWYPAPFNSGSAGIIRSFVTAILVVLLVRTMERGNIRLKI